MHGDLTPSAKSVPLRMSAPECLSKGCALQTAGAGPPDPLTMAAGLDCAESRRALQLVALVRWRQTRLHVGP